MKNKMGLCVLVTGAASGIGKALTEQLSARGHRVYALDIAPIETKEGAVPFTCDVTDCGAIEDVLTALDTENVRLDAIVCAAGIHSMTSFVEGDVIKMKRLIEINLLGVMQTVRAYHRLLSPEGRVVIVTSEVAAYDPMPFNGLYNVSKTALECYAQSLRQELNLLGQMVITVRPGATETPLADSTTRSTRELSENTVLYKGQASRFLRLVNKFKGTPIPPEKIAAILCKAITAKHPRLVYTKHRSIGLVLLSLLPLRLQCAVIKLLLSRKSKQDVT